MCSIGVKSAVKPVCRLVLVALAVSWVCTIDGVRAETVYSCSHRGVQRAAVPQPLLV